VAPHLPIEPGIAKRSFCPEFRHEKTSRLSLVPGKKQRENRPQRPRFKLRTWGTLRVVLSGEGPRACSLDRGSLIDSGLVIPGHPPVLQACLLHASKRQPQDPGSNGEPGAPSVRLYFPETYRSDTLSSILMTANTKTSNPGHPSEGEARAFARTKLGSDAVEVEPGKWRSRDGKWQYRAKPGDVSDNHVHLEQLNPQTGEVIQNLHIRWPEGTGRP